MFGQEEFASSLFPNAARALFTLLLYAWIATDDGHWYLLNVWHRLAEKVGQCQVARTCLLTTVAVSAIS